MKSLIEKPKFKKLKKSYTGAGEEINVGDLVQVTILGYQYDSYADAFEYFKFRNSECRELKQTDTQGHIMGMAVHPHFKSVTLVAIETEEGGQYILSSDGLGRITGKSDKISYEVALRHFVQNLQIGGNEKLWELIKKTRIQDLDEVKHSHYLHNVHKADIIEKTDLF